MMEGPGRGYKIHNLLQALQQASQLRGLRCTAVNGSNRHILFERE